MNPPVVAYLDHAATTPVRAEVLVAMLPFFGSRFGNPSGSHRVARDARKAIDEARDVVAGAIGCRPSEVVFTGCGTEADNAALVGAMQRHVGPAVCSEAEHHAVLHVVEHREGRVVGVDAAGARELKGRVDAQRSVEMEVELRLRHCLEEAPERCVPHPTTG